MLCLSLVVVCLWLFFALGCVFLFVSFVHVLRITCLVCLSLIDRLVLLFVGGCACCVLCVSMFVIGCFAGLFVLLFVFGCFVLCVSSFIVSLRVLIVCVLLCYVICLWLFVLCVVCLWLFFCFVCLLLLFCFGMFAMFGCFCLCVIVYCFLPLLLRILFVFGCSMFGVML